MIPQGRTLLDSPFCKLIVWGMAKRPGGTSYSHHIKTASKFASDWSVVSIAPAANGLFDGPRLRYANGR
ncbi:hypothetical protein DS906_00640 [Ruegeria sp. A3M17]|nr:hypothetical protein DS906_00640 [Ruegeria sp. A3M17]